MRTVRSGLGVSGIVLMLAGGIAIAQERKTVAEPADARQVFDATLAKAATEEKSVFLYVGGLNCGWCDRLRALLSREDVSEILGRDYIVIEIDTDRMKGATEVVQRCSPGALTDGIPWYVILDARGKAIITSDGPEGNVGYPLQPQGIAHFLSMIRKTSRRIKPAQMDRLKLAIEDEAAKFGRRSNPHVSVAGISDDGALREDRNRIQGTWTVKKCLIGDQEVRSPDGPFLLSFKDDKMWVTIHGQRGPRGATFKLDTSKNPRAIDLGSEGFKAVGIYEFDGKRLRICYNPKDRPTRFVSKVQAEKPYNVIYELERE